MKVVGYNSQWLSLEARSALAVNLFSQKVLSLGQAARLAEMPLWEFIPFLGERGVPYADYDDDYIAKEIETAKWLASKLGN